MSYIKPTSTAALPGNLTLNQFLQTVLVGMSGYDGTLVRPNWQVAPAKNPDLPVDWIAFGVITNTPDANGFIGMDSVGATHTQRHETLEVQCSIYGPKASETYALIRDGFQIPQNLEALRRANMGIVEVGPGQHVPDLVNERWINRMVTSIVLRREIQRVYPILPILSAEGVIHTVLGDEEYLMDWETAI